ncbi:MAG: cyclic nucleotide-binding/CBS domain-containing protein [Gammaproteobacteria bacterium]|nr:cyclic nucleotide-binding/CBS domain-containing protein [Gammaproteobacteria bacterium]
MTSENSATLQPELNSIRDFLLECIPFDELPIEQVNRIVNHIEISYHRKGTIFKSDENEAGLRIVRSGAVELRSENNRLLDRVGEGFSFNLMGLNQEQPGIHAVLIEDCLIYYLPEKSYQGLRQEFRYFNRFFHSQRSRRVRRAARHEPNPSDMMRPIKDLINGEIFTVTPNTSIQQCAAHMSEKRISSILITQQDSLLGIVTDRDIRSRAVAQGLDLQANVSVIMTEEPRVIDAQASLFDATLLMTQLGIHHLPVVENKQLSGIISASDLMRAKQDDPVYLVQHISRQTELSTLTQIAQSIPNLLVQWVHAGIRAHQVSHIFTAISDAITHKLIHFAEQKLGPAPVPYCWLGFGSQGRSEQLLGADQDNGLIIHNSMQPEDAPWFEQLAHFVCDGLNACGYEYCKGKVMATTNEWRQPLHEWQVTVDRWTRSPTDDAVMRVSIFFDLRCVHGDQTLCDELQTYMLKKTSSNSIFLAALAQNALSNDPPLGIFRRFVVEHNGEHADQLNVKKRGIIPIVDIVRLHALANQVTAVNTLDRLQKLVECKAMTMVDSRNLQDALRVIMQARIENQAQQIINGESPNHYLNPDNMSKLLRKQLKDAFSIVKDAQLSVKNQYRQGMA